MEMSERVHMLIGTQLTTRGDGQPHGQRLLELALRDAFKRAELRKHVKSDNVEL